jgi:hypothetical protein
MGRFAENPWEMGAFLGSTRNRCNEFSLKIGDSNSQLSAMMLAISSTARRKVTRRLRAEGRQRHKHNATENRNQRPGNPSPQLHLL